MNKKKITIITTSIVVALVFLINIVIGFANTDDDKIAIKTASITKIETGTSNFTDDGLDYSNTESFSKDSGFTMGNDSNSENRIIRSFDKLIYRFSISITGKEDNNDYDDRDVSIKVTLPDEVKDYVAFNENEKAGDKEHTFTFNNISSYFGETYDVSITLYVLGAPSNLKIAPKFEIQESTNTDSNYVVTLGNNNNNYNYEYDKDSNKYTTTSTVLNYMPTIVSSKSMSANLKLLAQNVDGQKVTYNNETGRYITFVFGVEMVGSNSLVGYTMPNGNDINFDYSISQDGESDVTIQDSFIRLYSTKQVDDIENISVSLPYSDESSDYSRSIKYPGNISMSNNKGIIKDYNITFNGASITATNEQISSSERYIGTYAVTVFSKRSKNDGSNDINVNFNLSNASITDTNNNKIDLQNVSASAVNKYYEYSDYSLYTSFLDSEGNSIESTHGAGSSSKGTTIKYQTSFKYKKNISNQGLKEVIKVDPTAFRVVPLNDSEIEISSSDKSLNSSDFEIKYISGNFSNENYEISNSNKKIDSNDLIVVNSNCPKNLSDLSTDQIMNLYGGPCINAKDIFEKEFSKITEAKTDNGEEIPITKIVIQTKNGVKLPDDVTITINVGLRVRNVSDITNTYQVTSVASSSDYDDVLSYYAPRITNDSGSITNPDNYTKTVYYGNDAVVDSYHFYGNSLKIVNFTARSDISVTNKNSDGTTKINYNVYNNETINYVVKTNISDNAINVGADDAWYINYLKVKIVLPSTLNFINDNSNLNPEIYKTDSYTELTYTLPYTKPNMKINDISFNVSIIPNLKGTGVPISVTSYTEAININNEKDTSIFNDLISTFEIYATGMNNVIVSQKHAETGPLVEKNTEFGYLLSAYNNTTNNINDYEILDILPKNGVDGSKIDGTYKVKVILPSSLSSAKVTCSTQTDISKEISNAYNEFNECNATTEYVSASAIKIENIKILKDSYMEDILISIKPEENSADDKYVNSFIGGSSVYPQNESNKIDVSIISRQISGKVFIDNNENAVFDEGDKLVENLPVTLYKIKSDNLTKISETITDKDGNYSFKNLEIGRYKIRINYDSDLYDLTLRYGTEDETIDSDGYKISEGVAEISGKATPEESEGIILSKSVISQNNMDLGLLSKREFYMDVSKYITKVDLSYNNIIDSHDYNNENKVKLDVRNSLEATAKVYYGIKITNNSSKAGYVKIVEENIPEGMEFDSSDLYNDGWFSVEGKLQNVSLENELINPGESKYLKIALNMPRQEEGKAFLNTVFLTKMQEYVKEELVSDIKNENDNKYIIGESVSYAGVNWHVISASDTEDGQKLTLLADSGTVKTKMGHTSSSSDIYKWSSSLINSYINNGFLSTNSLNTSILYDNSVCDDASGLQVASYGGTLLTDGTCQSNIYVSSKIRLLTEKEFLNIKNNYSNISWLFGNNDYYLQNSVFVNQDYNSYGQVTEDTDVKNLAKYVSIADSTIKNGYATKASSFVNSTTKKEVRPVIEINSKYILQN